VPDAPARAQPVAHRTRPDRPGHSPAADRRGV